jgi:energy-coupling factor transport system substrate-specific component
MTLKKAGGPLKLGVVTLGGLALFLWPFVGGSAPPAAASLSIVVGMIAVLAFVEAATRQLDSRRFAVLAAIAAVDAALRLVVVIGIGGWSPIFFLILVAGYAYGPSFGFLCGATALLVSAVATGGIGPWLPYEAIACGWVGMAAGVAGLRRSVAPGRRDVLVLAFVGVVTGFAYGALLDVWDWTTFYRGAPDFGFMPGLSPLGAAARFGKFYLTTSLIWDSFRAVGNAIVILAIGAPVIAALSRLHSRFNVEVLADPVA